MIPGRADKAFNMVKTADKDVYWLLELFRTLSSGMRLAHSTCTYFGELNAAGIEICFEKVGDQLCLLPHLRGCMQCV